MYNKGSQALTRRYSGRGLSDARIYDGACLERGRLWRGLVNSRLAKSSVWFELLRDEIHERSLSRSDARPLLRLAEIRRESPLICNAHSPWVSGVSSPREVTLRSSHLPSESPPGAVRPES
jgi:hypothetical protein